MTSSSTSTHRLRHGAGGWRQGGELRRAGFPVPPGLCVTTAAYRMVAAGTALGEVIAALGGTPSGDLSVLSLLAGRALAAPVPAAVAMAVTRGYARLGRRRPTRGGRRCS
jgi:rifampicin phosphotransferase